MKNGKKIINLLSEETRKFDGLSNFVERLATEIQNAVVAGDYANASLVAKELVAVLDALDKHKKLDMNGPITVQDVDNLKPKIASYLASIAKDDSTLRLWSAVGVHVNLDTVLMSS